MRLTLLAMSVVFVAVGAGAQPSAQPTVQPGPSHETPIQITGKKTPDLNEVVCEKEQDTGSRLMTHEVCMTRGQWMEERRQERMDIDKAQVERPMQN